MVLYQVGFIYKIV